MEKLCISILKAMKARIMTREEEIRNYAYNNCINDDIDDTSYSLIIETASWADETMIEKAVKWMKGQVYQEYGGGPLERLIPDERIEDFRKAMEE